MSALVVNRNRKSIKGQVADEQDLPGGVGQDRVGGGVAAELFAALQVGFA
jgi:hypothetical protein